MDTLEELHQKYPATDSPEFHSILTDFLRAEQRLGGMSQLSHAFEDERAATQLITAKLRAAPWSISDDDLYDISGQPAEWLQAISDYQLTQEGAA